MRCDIEVSYRTGAGRQTAKLHHVSAAEIRPGEDGTEVISVRYRDEDPGLARPPSDYIDTGSLIMMMVLGSALVGVPIAARKERSVSLLRAFADS